MPKYRGLKFNPVITPELSLSLYDAMKSVTNARIKETERDVLGSLYEGYHR